uniref:Uncharacterized protein n=1 Tax=Ciona savignyi TaxID=51511 RepID=H2Z305_CIOSA
MTQQNLSFQTWATSPLEKICSVIRFRQNSSFSGFTQLTLPTIHLGRRPNHRNETRERQRPSCTQRRLLNSHCKLTLKLPVPECFEMPAVAIHPSPLLIHISLNPVFLKKFKERFLKTFLQIVH